MRFNFFTFKKKSIYENDVPKSFFKDAYQKLAVKYNQHIDYKPHNAFYDRPNTLSLFEDVKDCKILDAGCGPGKYAEILSSKGANITGFDFSPKMIELALERNIPNSHFFVHDLSDPLPNFEDNSFDYVLCALSLDYIEDWNPVMKEFQRLLKPGGNLIFTVMHPFFDYEYYKSKNYFKTELCSSVWTGFKEQVKVFSYRRSLQEIVNPVIKNNFKIEVLLEPLPTEEFKKSDPNRYEKLMKFPSFICIKASKL